MSDILTHTLSGFWQFIGCIVILCLTLQFGLTFLLKWWIFTLRHLNVWKHGWPPAKCSPDGIETLNENN